MDLRNEQTVKLLQLQNRIQDRKGLVACGRGFSMALHSRGHVLYAGANRFGQKEIAEQSRVSVVVGDSRRAVGLLNDGTLCLYGLPTPADHRFRGLTHVRAVSVCGDHTAVLLGNGHVVVSEWKWDVSEWPSVTDVVCGWDFVAGLTRDGRIVVAGNHRRFFALLMSKERIAGIFTDCEGGSLFAITAEGRLLSSRPLPRRVEKWKNLVFVAANRRSIRGVTAGGELLSSEALREEFPKHCHFVACAASATHTVALTRDGLVLAAGGNEFGQCQTSAFGTLFPYFDEFIARRQEERQALAGAERTYRVRRTEAIRYQSRILCGRRVTACITADSRVLATGGFLKNREWSHVKALSGGNAHLVALHEDGTVSAAGNDVHGCLAVEEWKQIKSIATGRYHTLGVTEDGRVLFCGRNHAGQGNVTDWTGVRAVFAADTYTVGLGYDGGIRIAGTPPFDPALIDASWHHPAHIAVASTHMAALYPDGRVRSTVMIPASDQPGDGMIWNTADWQYVRAIVAGAGFTVGLCFGGRVVSVGEGREPAWDLSEWKNILFVACGRHYVAGLTADGHVRMVGDPNGAEAGQAEHTARLLHPHLWQDVLTIHCGPHHLAAITRNGHVLAYGADGESRCSAATHFTAFRDLRQLYGYGQYSQRLEEEILAQRVAEIKTEPVVVEEGVLPFGRISAPWRQEAATLAGRLWGDDDFLSWKTETGEIRTYSYHSHEIVSGDSPAGEPCDEGVGGSGDTVTVLSSGRHTVTLLRDGRVEATGENTQGECETQNWRRVIRVAVLPHLTVGLRADGQLLVAGRYGEGLRVNEPVCSVATFGRFRVVLVTADGGLLLYEKGAGRHPVSREDMRLFDAPVSSSVADRYVPGGRPACTVLSAERIFAVGMGHLLTLGEGGSITAAGSNDLGQCDVRSHGEGLCVAAGPYHSAVITLNGTLALSGRNTDGECDANTLNRELDEVGGTFEEARHASVTPAQTASEKAYAWRSVACGYNHTAALRSDGRVFAVGANPDGRCDTRKWRGVTRIACGVRHTVAVTDGGECLAVGNNRYGQCDVSHLKGIVAVAAGEFHTVALRKDGKVVAVGDNRMGQCRVTDLDHVISIACLPDATLCVCADGRVVIRGGSGRYNEAVAALRDVIAVHACEHRIVAMTVDRRLIHIPEV